MSSMVCKASVRAFAVAIAASMALPGMAQVAPPPPERGPEKPKLKAPPPRPPRPARPPVQTKPRPKAPSVIQVPDIPYEPLAKFDADGKLIPIEGSLEIAALKHNPTIGPATIERIRPILNDWQQRVDVMVVDNLDIMAEVDDGLFDNIDLADENEKMFMSEVFKMIISTGNPNNVLAQSNALTKTQMDFQRRLVADYVAVRDRAIAEDVAARMPGDDKETKQKHLIEGYRISLANMSAEKVRSYHALLITAAGMAGPALKAVDLSSEERAAAGAAADALKSATTDQQKIDGVKALLATMSLGHQHDFMKAVLEARGPAQIPELDDAAIKPNGLAPVEDIDAKSEEPK